MARIGTRVYSRSSFRDESDFDKNDIRRGCDERMVGRGGAMFNLAMEAWWAGERSLNRYQVGE